MGALRRTSNRTHVGEELNDTETPKQDRVLLVHVQVRLGEHSWDEIDGERDPQDHDEITREIAENALITGAAGLDYIVVAAEEIGTS